MKKLKLLQDREGGVYTVEIITRSRGGVYTVKNKKKTLSLFPFK